MWLKKDTGKRSSTASRSQIIAPFHGNGFGILHPAFLNLLPYLPQLGHRFEFGSACGLHSCMGQLTSGV